MGAYTCIKPATFAGVKYLPGDPIPADAIPADRVGAVIRLGLIAETPEPIQRTNEEPEQITIALPIAAEDGSVFPFDVTAETIQEAVTVLQMNAEEATKHIAGMTDESALIVIDACDSRQTVKKAAAKRAAAIEAAAAPAENGTGAPGTGEGASQ